MQLSVIIVNYNVKYFLEQCLHSVQKACRQIESEIIVADNNSTDGSRAYLEDNFPAVKFIWNSDNIGFAKANNIALQQASGEYILFLNPDTLVAEDCFEKCISYLQSHKEAGALGVKMLDGAGTFLKESKRSFPSPVTSFFKLSGLAGLFPQSKIFSKYHLGYLNENASNEVDVLAGAFMMIPKKVLDKTGSFDEDFFMYGEDIDLSYRIQEAGYKNFYFSETQIMHFKGESTKKGSLNYVRLFYKAMSIFAKKHYGSSKAGIFNFFIQAAILFRAFISACARFVKWIGMPVIDTAVILMSFWIVKLVWNMYVKKDVNYSPNMLIIAFPAFALIFFAAAYFSGLYDNGYKQKRLNYSTVIAFLLLLSFYSLLPESWRFSRGILVFGCLLAFIFIAAIRLLLVKWKIIETSGDDEQRQTIIVGSQKDVEAVNVLMQTAGMEERVLGRVSVSEMAENNTIGSAIQLKYLLKKYPIKEVIFCEGILSFKKIIDLCCGLPGQIRIKIHAHGATGIIGSDSKNISGKIVSGDKTNRLATPVNKRNKKITDVLISLLFILTFPVNILLQKNIWRFYKNVFDVLLLKKTWIGYACDKHNGLFLKKGILTTTGLPALQNTLPQQSLQASDKWYATDYTLWQDIKIIFRGYKFLSE